MWWRREVKQIFEAFFFLFLCKSNECLSSAEKPWHNNIYALLFTLSKADLLFYLLVYFLCSQVTTSYFSPLAACSADLIQRFQASQTPCCLFSLLHSQMAAGEDPGTLGWIFSYNMYLQKPSDSLLFLLVLFLLLSPSFTLSLRVIRSQMMYRYLHPCICCNIM